MQRKPITTLLISVNQTFHLYKFRLTNPIKCCSQLWSKSKKQQHYYNNQSSINIIYDFQYVKQKRTLTISWSWYRIPTCVKKITLHVGMKNVEKCAGERINKSLIFILHFAQKRIEWGITKQKPTSFLCSSRWLMNYSLEEWNEFRIQLEKNIDWVQWCMADYTRLLTKLNNTKDYTRNFFHQRADLPSLINPEE